MLPHHEQPPGQSKAVARKTADLLQRMKGRVPLKYELTVIPFFCGES